MVYRPAKNVIKENEDEEDEGTAKRLMVFGLVYIKNKVSTIRLSNLKALKRKPDRRTVKKAKETLYAKVSFVN